ncbi:MULTISPECIES: immune inhibitor A domain-containing protein [Micromonospora]|uniref:M6 family metalloprotease domain-containing protein n=1 Tax=Micromonospora solifontis TaxID=2487138 RepID=A0ABX9WQ73_9ACTN|nr:MULTISPECIES: immune inhibitor A domain-containing protein [Micromonospora]NES13285.1 M6 family metalloprotease domain-containing protein [Micromonospora sp. PPF5-17B]NES34654.1 M6 family metalloprotease domain-containing protein [Micromonospora solifontis]NES57170.1 M6 family metalloprotease domain-containing protein [Micromonospora sp. PPF5-6]RNM01897.1 M6 family metalloprotease domain-containing protein [Micromonospora solifontis]
MRRRVTAGLASAAAALLAAGVVTAPASAAPVAEAAPGADKAKHGKDNLPDPKADQQREIKKQAISDLLRGKAKLQTRNGSKVIQVKDDLFVEYQQAPKEDPIFTMLVNFGDKTDPRTGGSAGPVVNQIPEPDRNWDGSSTDNNSTLWRSDFHREHYMDMFYGEGESFRDFYLKQSGGRYTVNGDVSDWVTVPYNEARYGSNAISEADGYWNFVKDSATSWYDAQVQAGKTPQQIKDYLAQFDQWDRYDYDGDGNFNEPDGYIDHFQAVHAGEGEEAGGGAQGEDAIWSHRWAAFPNLEGKAGPAGNLAGGVQIGDTGMWIRDYTTEPENGGLGVFAHEYGHDLGLPDLYDTAGGDNGTGFWTLMSSGSWLSHGIDDIGSTPGYMDPWSKLYLGWLNHSTVDYGSGTTKVTLGPAGDSDGPKAQAVVVNLPAQTQTTNYNTPFGGSYEWWGGSADDLNTTLTRTLDLTGATSASITAKAQWDIEEDYDFLYAEVSTDGGATWAALHNSLIDAGETGVDGSTSGNWVDLTYDLSAYAGKSVTFRYRYATDGGVHLAGPFLDNISLTKNGTIAWTDDAETLAAEWTAKGWTRMGGSVTASYPRFYIAENRTYFGYDDTLRTGGYNFGWGNTRPDFVERFSNQPGMLVWYVNYAYGDNNTSQHPGYGLNLPVDVRPGKIQVGNQGTITNRRNGYDATFSLYAKPAQTFHKNGVEVTVPELDPTPVFTDNGINKYWNSNNPWNSVKVAGTGTKIEILEQGTTPTSDMVIKITN